MSVRLSIRRRLAVSASCLVLAVVAAIASVAYREVRRSAVLGASDHLQTVSHQLGEMFGASARQVLAQAIAAATDPAIAAALHGGHPGADTAALRVLRHLGGNGASVISAELWDASGQRRITTHTVAEESGDLSRSLMSGVDGAGDERPGASVAAISPIQVVSGVLGYDVIAPVAGSDGHPAGFVVTRRRVGGTTQTTSQLSALIGSQSRLLVGNTRGGVWTDLAQVTQGPPVGKRTAAGVLEYQTSGVRMIAAVTPIANTPWSVAVEAPRSIALVPAHTMLWRLGLVTLVLLLLAAVGAWILSGTFTRPIAEMATAAEAISAGNYDQRLPAERSDEIGAFAVVFNTMAERIASMMGALGTKVAELEDAESRFRLLFERLQRVIASSGAVLFEVRLDKSGPVLEWISDNVTRTLGYEMNETFAPGWWNASVHPMDRQRVPGQSDAAPFRDAATEYRFRHKDGRYRWLREEQRVIVDARTGTRKVIGAWIDLTDQRQLESRLQQAQKMEAIGRLAGGVAHDFNNLLTVMIAESQILSRDPHMSLADRTESIDEIRKAADRATLLTRQLLTFSRHQLVEQTKLDVNAVVTDVDKMLRRLIGEDIEIRTRLSDAAVVTLADRGQLEQVIVNLAVNARDAMPHGGTLTIETSVVALDQNYCESRDDVSPGDYVLLAVSDTGTGMSDDVKSHVFEPFFTTKESGKGTGLGLATCYAIMRQFRGHISVYSETSVGTTMKVYLPLAAGSAQAERASKVVTAQGGTETILLVEDDAAVRKLTAKMLSRHGYHVLQAADADQALALMKESGPTIQLLMTDVVLPRVGGRELAERVIAVWPQIRVLFASGYSDDIVLQHRLTEHNVVLIQKPFTDAGLCEKVREALERPTRRLSPTMNRAVPGRKGVSRSRQP